MANVRSQTSVPAQSRWTEIRRPACGTNSGVLPTASVTNVSGCLVDRIPREGNLSARVRVWRCSQRTCISSLLLLIWLETGGHRPMLHHLGRRSTIWAGQLCSACSSMSRIGPFYVLFLFAMIAAAFRWGFVETIGTALFSVAFLLVQLLLAIHGPAVLRTVICRANWYRYAWQCDVSFCLSLVRCWASWRRRKRNYGPRSHSRTGCSRWRESGIASRRFCRAC